MDSPSDAEVIGRSLGEPDAFGLIYDRHAATLLRFLGRRVGAKVAEGLVGELFRVAFERRKTFDGSRASALPWLYGIGSNLLLKHRRGEARRLRASARMAADRDVADRRASTAALEARVPLARVAAAIEALPDGEREALLLFAWEAAARRCGREGGGPARSRLSFRKTAPHCASLGGAVARHAEAHRTQKENTMANAQATWTIDPVHSSVEFSLDYMGFSTYRTGFRALEGSLEFDPARPAAASVTASIPVDSVDVTNDRLMSRLMDADLLGGKDHPTIAFKSTRVEAVDPARWKVTGDLTIHGTTRPVVLDTRYLGQAKHPFSGKIAAGFRAETAIDRRDFGVTWNAAMDTGGAYLGERVQISLAILAQRQD